jgi:hypothetical protein
MEKMKVAHRSDIIKLNNIKEHAEADEWDKLKAERQGGQQQNMNKWLGG